MNIFNKPIRTEEEEEHTFMSLGEFQVRSGWLKDHPQYTSMILTCIHMSSLLSGIEYLQQDANDKNLFKMAEMNKEVNEIVQGRRLYELKPHQTPVSEQPEGKWDLIVQKVAGLFDTCYTRICHIKGFRMEIESQKKKQPSVVDLRNYTTTIEFKGDQKDEKSNAKPSKEDKEKSLFRWVEGYPVRIFLSAENQRPYAIYLSKVTKARQLLDYFEMKRSSSGFARHKQAIFRYAQFFKKNVVAAFAEKLQDNGNRSYKNPREVFIEENAPVNTAPAPEQTEINSPKAKRDTSVNEISSPTRRLQRGSSIRFEVKKNESHEQNYDGMDEPLSAMVRRRQISFVDDSLRVSPLRRLNPVEEAPDEFMLNDHSKQAQKQSEKPQSQSISPDSSSRIQVHEVEFEEENANIINEREQEAQQAGSARLDLVLQVKELFVYVKHFQPVIRMELMQCMRSEIETSKEGSVLYPVASYELELQQSPTNPQLFLPKHPSHELRFSSSMQEFRCLFKFPIEPVETLLNLETSTKYQKWSERAIYIKSVPFAGRLAVMFSRIELKPYNRLSTLQFLSEFLKSPNYDRKYLFMEQGKQRLEADESFKERVWALVLDRGNDNDELLEKQVFLGVPERFRERFFRLLTEGKDVPLNTLTKLEFHELKLAKQSLPEKIIDDLQEYLSVEDLLERLLRFECNRLMKERLHGVLLFHRYKYGQCRNILYVFLHVLFRKLEPVILANCTSRQQLLRLFDLHYEVEFELDEFFSELFNYL